MPRPTAAMTTGAKANPPVNKIKPVPNTKAPNEIMSMAQVHSTTDAMMSHKNASPTHEHRPPPLRLLLIM